MVDETRETAKQTMRRIMAELGFRSGEGNFSQAEIDQLFTSMDDWIMQGFTGDDLYLLFRSDAKTAAIYNRRFPGMAALASKGQSINEREYISLEREYRRVLSSYGLPTEFYDNWDDYGTFIGNQVSVNEVEDRVVSAKQMLDGANPQVLRELNEYYGVSDGAALAYLLDGNKAQSVIRQQVRAAQIGGAAQKYGFDMDRTQSELLGNTSAGMTQDPFQLQTLAQLESTFGQARRVADRDRTLAGIDREAYTEMDTLQGAFGDESKLLESQRRARRERARFQGSAAVSGGSLSVSRNL